MGSIRHGARADAKRMMFKWSKNGRRRGEDHLNTIFTSVFASKWWAAFGRPPHRAAAAFGRRCPVGSTLMKTGVKIVFKLSSPRRRPFLDHLNTIF